MLKLTFSPLFSTDFLTKTKFSRTSKEIINVLKKQSTQTVRQNASTTNTPITINTTELHKLPPTSAYVHLPFCRKRCHYCDFPIIALGSSSSLQQSLDHDPRMVNYIQTLCREINATPCFLDHLNPPLETVFFGGGTPSLVPPGLVSQVLESLSSKFGLCLDAEISMEMDPGTFDAEKMKEMIKLGVNRVSLGVQAFQEDLLRACGRAHGVNEVYEAFEILKSCQVDNWSMDIISSLPHQTSKMWEETLRLTIQAQPPHISVYDLQVEQDTKFGLL